MAFGLVSPEAEKWCAEAAKLVQADTSAEPGFQQDLRCCLGLVRDALSGLSVAANLGFEAAARFLARVVSDTVQGVRRCCLSLAVSACRRSYEREPPSCPAAFRCSC